MANDPQITQPGPNDLDVINHPTLGKLSFPKSMGASDRNDIIQQMESDRQAQSSVPGAMQTRPGGPITQAPKEPAPPDTSLWGRVKNFGAGLIDPIKNLPQSGVDTLASWPEKQISEGDEYRGRAKDALSHGDIPGFIGHSINAALAPTMIPQTIESLQNMDPARASGNILTMAAMAHGPKMLDDAAAATAPARQSIANNIVSPLTYEGVGEAAADARMGIEPESAITQEGLVGTRKGLVAKTGNRVTQLKTAADQILQNHPNGSVQIDAAPHIHGAVDAAISEAQKAGQSTDRLEAVRDAMLTKFGATSGTPLEMNDLATKLQQKGRDLGAFKNTQPAEASAGAAFSDAARRIRDNVNSTIPDVEPLNTRMSNLLDARAGLIRGVNAEKGRPIFGTFGRGMVSSIANKTLGSAPVRTALARVINVGNTLEPPDIPSASAVIPGQTAGGVSPMQPGPFRGLLPAAGKTSGPRTSAGPGELPANPRPGNLSAEAHTPDVGNRTTAAVRFMHEGSTRGMGVPSTIQLPEGTTNPPLPASRQLTEGATPPPRVNTLIPPSTVEGAHPFPQTAPDAAGQTQGESIRLKAAPDTSGPIKPQTQPMISLRSENRQLPARGGTTGPKTVLQPSTSPIVTPAPGPVTMMSPYFTGKHEFSIFSAENPGDHALDPTENKIRTATTLRELRAAGYKPQLIQHTADNQTGTSIFVPDMPTGSAVNFQTHLQNKFGYVPQDNLITKQGVVNVADKTTVPIDFSKTSFGQDALNKPTHSVAAGGTPDAMPFAFEPGGNEIPLKSPYEGEHHSNATIKSGGSLLGSKRGAANPETGQPTGAEAARLRKGDGAPGGSAFYDKGTLAEPQIAARKHTYIYKGDAAIATIEDTPLWHDTMQKAYADAKAKGASNMDAHHIAANNAERALMNAGYDGYRSKNYPGITFKFGDTQVFKPGDEPEAPELSPHPNAPQPSPQPETASPRTSSPKVSAKTTATQSASKGAVKAAPPSIKTKKSGRVEF